MAHICNPSYSETEVGESLEPRRQRLQRAKIMPLYFSLGDRVRLHLKKRKNEKKKKMEETSFTRVFGLWQRGGSASVNHSQIL